jgi:hypothetical protein
MAQIRSASWNCLELFDRLCSLYSQTGESHLSPGLSDIQAFQGRLKVWCANLGVLQKEPASLDYRLREFDVIRHNVHKLLLELDDHISEICQVVSRARPALEDQAMPEDAYASHSDDDLDDERQNDQQEMIRPSELSMRVTSIDLILKDLYRLGFEIRSPHYQTASQKTLTYSQKDPVTGIDIFDSYAVSDLGHVTSLLASFREDRAPKAEPGDFLKLRLAASITARRRQLGYWEHHARKLAYNFADTENDQSTGDQALQDKEPVDGAKLAPTLPSDTEASNRMVASGLDETMETATIVTTASTARDFEGRTVEIPAPPSSAQQGDFVCPYCNVLCAQKYSVGKAWR